MLWPAAEERKLLGRFYLAGVLGYGFAIILPFEFAYLYLALDMPDWAIIPVLVSTAVALVMELPTGFLSDRWSRKGATLLGYGLGALSWLFVPSAVALDGSIQLAAVTALFAMDGLGKALVSGSEEAWAVDNLSAAKRADLTDLFFSRSYSFDSLGSIVAGIVATYILVTATVDRATLDWFWVVTAGGQLLALAISATIPEHRLASRRDATPATRWPGLTAVRAALRMKPVFLFVAVLVIACFADSITDDAFVISMLMKGLDARALAPLAIVEDVIGLTVPLFALGLARRMGLRRYLATFLVIPAALVWVLVISHDLWVVVALCLLLDICAMFWDPVAEAHFQRLIPSQHRATLSSAVNQLAGFAELAGLGVFALMLGSNRAALQDATPDLLDAFSSAVQPMPEVPSGILGVSVPDLAILVFLMVGLLAVAVLNIDATFRLPHSAGVAFAPARLAPVTVQGKPGDGWVFVSCRSRHPGRSCHPRLGRSPLPAMEGQDRSPPMSLSRPGTAGHPTGIRRTAHLAPALALALALHFVRPAHRRPI